MKKIIILTHPSELTENYNISVGFLFECAPDSVYLLKFKKAFFIESLIGNINEKIFLAGNLTNTLLVDEPLFRDIPQLTIFKEVIAVELHRAFHLIHLHDFLVNNGFNVCEFKSVSWWGDELKKLSKRINSSLQIHVPCENKPTRTQRVLNRILSSKLSIKTILLEAKRLCDFIDPFHCRTMLLERFRKKKYGKNKPWYYTTAINYTNIALLYEPYFPEKFEYLVEGFSISSRPLKRNNKNFINLYRFSSPKFIPKKTEIKAVETTIYKHLLNKEISQADTLARDVLLDSDWFNMFITKLLPYGLFSSSVFKSWISETKPSMVIVGNVVFEGYAMYNASFNKIPVVLLQHGVFSNYFQYLDFPINHYIARGKYFFERLSSSAKNCALILNPPATVKKKSVALNKVLVFLTSPLHLRLQNSDIESIITSLIQTASETKLKLIVRVHPLERIIDYKNIFEKTQKNINCQIDVSFEQGGDIDSLLCNAIAVITFGSTVFIDCLRNSVPIIGFEWIDIGLNDLKNNNSYYFAKTIADFKNLIIKASKSELSSGKETMRNILIDTSEEVIKSTLLSIINNAWNKCENNKDRHV